MRLRTRSCGAGAGLLDAKSSSIVVSSLWGDIVAATANHPFWVEDEGAWTNAADLEPGHHLLYASGTNGMVVATAEFSHKATVHNIAVSGIHTYYVLAGQTPVLVHNSGGGGGPNFTIAGDYTGRIDRFTYRGQAYFEVHVYYKGSEVGIYGSNGWIGKHGHSSNMNLGDTVENRLKGVAVDEMRRAGRLGPNDTIKGDAWKRPHVGEWC